jgi:DNA polymerase-3 subunit gamma/tau
LSYQVIARKWRPQAFDQIVGQDHITQTLVNALRGNRLHHALIFTGPRGTGKTSSARILAKSLRCPNAVNFIPCHNCENCHDIALGKALDVLEIDGASNNGVDAIRDLRETVGYMPSSGKFKVYIIDEVHMLSISAFNALLKTLEEPPDNVIFIFATTEIHKIPQTILSRCQRFDFRRITTKQIAERLKLICSQENVQAEEGALWTIARQGDGSMRDSQSLLDQVITFANGALTQEIVVNILGLTDRSLLLQTISAIAHRNHNEMLAVLKNLHSSGTEADLFMKELLEIVRHLLLIKVTTDHFSQLIEMPESEIDDLKRISQDLSEEDIHLLFDMALKATQDVGRAQDPRLVMEVVLLRLISAPKIFDLQKLLDSSFVATQQVSANGDGSHPHNPVATNHSPKNQPTQNSHAGSSSRAIIDESLPDSERWLQFANKVRVEDPVLSAKVEALLFVESKNQVLKLAIPAQLTFLKDQMTAPNVRKKLEAFIDQFWGHGYSLEIRMTQDKNIGHSAQSMEKKKISEKEEHIKNQIYEHPLIKSAQEVFKGQITSIREMNKNSRT